MAVDLKSLRHGKFALLSESAAKELNLATINVDFKLALLQDVTLNGGNPVPVLVVDDAMYKSYTE